MEGRILASPFRCAAQWETGQESQNSPWLLHARTQGKTSQALVRPVLAQKRWNWWSHGKTELQGWDLCTLDKGGSGGVKVWHWKFKTSGCVPRAWGSGHSWDELGALCLLPSQGRAEPPDLRGAGPISPMEILHFELFSSFMTCG